VYHFSLPLREEMRKLGRAEREVLGMHKNQNIFSGNILYTMLRDLEYGKFNT
jgi:hypothetical protein